MTSGDNAFTDAQANCSADGMEEAGIAYESINVAADDVDPALAEELTGIFFDCALNS